MAGQKNGTTSAPLTKMEAVKQTLQELGRTTMPVAIKDHLKKRYNIEISADVANNYKKKLLKQAKAAATPQAATPAARRGSRRIPATPPVQKASAPPKKAASPAKKPAAPKPQAPAAQPKAKAADETRHGGSILLEDVLRSRPCWTAWARKSSAP